MNFFKGMLLGLATGDAVGVPHEFKRRDVLIKQPVTGMDGYGTHQQPPGTWSDDTSLALCTADALIEKFDIDKVAANFKDWLRSGLWTARGRVFDVGITTQNAIYRLEQNVLPEDAGGDKELDNGNGSLMRILPVLRYTFNQVPAGRFETTRLISSITHRHIRSVIACFYLLEFAREVVISGDFLVSYSNVQSTVLKELRQQRIPESEIILFQRLLTADISRLPPEEIQSTGYVLHALEASIWSILTTNSFQEAVLKAVNLGEDTDTTGAITGAIAGLFYGVPAIPEEWLSQLARKHDIEALGDQLHESFLAAQIARS